MRNRVGFGFDVHRLEEGQSFILGGVKLEFYKGTVAHSDGDVLIHSICDALLGAAGLRDIGVYFPDNDATLKDISSLTLLERTIVILNERGYKIINIDSTICLQEPKIMQHIPQMKEKLSKTTGTDTSNISIKATTTENLGFIGAGEGISCYSVVLIENAEIIQ